MAKKEYIIMKVSETKYPKYKRNTKTKSNWVFYAVYKKIFNCNFMFTLKQHFLKCFLPRHM